MNQLLFVHVIETYDDRCQVPNDLDMYINVSNIEYIRPHRNPLKTWIHLKSGSVMCVDGKCSAIAESIRK